jgi:hypothetical protein
MTEAPESPAEHPLSAAKLSFVAQSAFYNSDTIRYLPPLTDVAQLPIAQCYLNPGQSWLGGMWSSYFTSVAKAAERMIVTIPLLVGQGWHVGAPGWIGPQGRTMSPQSPTDKTGSGNAPTLMTLADVAAGKWDAMWTPTAKAIAKVRPDAEPRIGWERYGNWYAWGGPANAAEERAAYQHVVDLFREVSPQFRFIWDGGAVTGSGFNPVDPVTGSYPGDAYVDMIAADVYDSSPHATGPWGAQGWAANASGGLPYIERGYAFARAHGKPFCIPEFGTLGTVQGALAGGAFGGGDDLPWIQAIVKWLQTAPGIDFGMYWDDPSTPGGGFKSAPLIAAWLGPVLRSYGA